MLTIEDMKKDMEKDPELKENLQRQMEYFFPRWMGKKSKEDMIENHQGICFIKKLFAMDYVMGVFLEIYQNQLFQEWDGSFSEAKIKEFLKKWRGVS